MKVNVPPRSESGTVPDTLLLRMNPCRICESSMVVASRLRRACGLTRR